MPNVVTRAPGRPRALRRALVTGVVAVAASVGVASAATQQAAAAGPTSTARPSISGTAQQGLSLTATPGTWQGQGTIDLAYQWQRCDDKGQACASIAGAAAPTYALTSADVGNTVRVVVTATDGTGSASAASDPSGVVTSAAPANTAPPVVTGEPRTGANLSASTGTWSGTAPLTYAYAWQRCDANGASCSAIASATQPTYALAADDAGHPLRVVVTARNAFGAADATSVPTAPIALGAPASLIDLPGGVRSVAAADVRAPYRLVLDRVRFSPNPIRSRGPVSASFHVADTRGYSVRGALVLGLGLPYGRVDVPDEAATDAAGWARVTFHPTTRLPLVRGGALVVFVRARVAGDRLIAGVSTRRLVQVRVTAP